MKIKNTLPIILSIIVATALITQAQGQVKVAKARGVAVSPFITGGEAPNPLPIGSTFSINVSALDVEKLWGYQFMLSYNTTVLTETGYTTYAPFDQQKKAEEINETSTSYLMVNGFDKNKTDVGWKRTGPQAINVYYLNAIDYSFPPGVAGYINGTTDGSKIGDFSFQDLKWGEESAPWLADGPVYIEIYANQSAAGDDDVDIMLYNATSQGYDRVATLTPPTGPLSPTSWTTSPDVSSWLHNITLIDNAKVYLVKKTNGATEDNIMIDAMRLRVESAYGYVSLSWGTFNGDKVGATGANVTLAKINFSVDAAGISKLDIHDSKLSDVNGLWKDATIAGYVEQDGYYGEIPIHDVAVTSVTATPTSVTLGDQVTIDVTVANKGDFNETFMLETAYNLTNINFKSIENRTVTSLPAGQNTTQRFTWTTPTDKEISCVVRGKAYLTTDMVLDNNEGFSGMVTIKKPAYTPWIIYGAVAAIVIIIGAAVGISLIRRRKK